MLPIIAKTTKYHALSIVYFEHQVAAPSLQYPADCRGLLPPCFPAHAAPAWESRLQAGGPPELRGNFERSDGHIQDQTDDQTHQTHDRCTQSRPPSRRLLIGWRAARFWRPREAERHPGLHHPVSQPRRAHPPPRDRSIRRADCRAGTRPSAEETCRRDRRCRPVRRTPRHPAGPDRLRALRLASDRGGSRTVDWAQPPPHQGILHRWRPQPD